MNVSLRDVTQDDLPAFFEFQRDPEAIRMISYLPRDPNDQDAFMSHWNHILSRNELMKKTILLGDAVVGNICSYELFGNTDVGFWIDRAFWGKGIATRALQLFLQIQTIRPLYAHVLNSNEGSLRVLEKCGFKKIGTEENEIVLRLEK